MSICLDESKSVGRKHNRHRPNNALQPTPPLPLALRSRSAVQAVSRLSFGVRLLGLCLPLGRGFEKIMGELIPPGYKAPQSVEELMSRYANGERYFAHADIPDGADLQGAVLEDAILEHAWLSDANCQGASLQRVNFRHSNVKCTIFRDANLQDASFEEASVEAADFAGANMSGVSFAGAGYYGYRFQPGESPVDD